MEGDQLLIVRRPEGDPFAEARVVSPTQYVVITRSGYQVESAEQIEGNWNLVATTSATTKTYLSDIPADGRAHTRVDPKGNPIHYAVALDLETGFLADVQQRNKRIVVKEYFSTVYMHIPCTVEVVDALISVLEAARVQLTVAQGEES